MITVVLILFALFLYFKFKVFPFNAPKNSEPPAVPGSLPILGHLLALGENPHLKVIEWAKVHGSLFTIKLGGQKTFVVDDPKLLKEIFSQSAFSGRADNAAFEYFAGGRNGIIHSEEKHWELQRRFTLKHLRDFGFGKNYVENLIAGEVNDVLETLKQQVNKPLLVQGTFNLPVLNALWILTSGKRLSGKDSVLIKLLLDLAASLNKILTTGAMYSPFIRRVAPRMSGWKCFTTAVDLLHNLESYGRDLIDTYISEIKSCEDPNSPFYKEVGYKNLRAILSDIFQAGSETTSTTLTWALLYLTVHSEVQEKLRNEIDNVVGKLRKPALSDRPKMPYVEAVILEILRKSSLLPLGFGADSWIRSWPKNI